MFSNAMALPNNNPVPVIDLRSNSNSPNESNESHITISSISGNGGDQSENDGMAMYAMGFVEPSSPEHAAPSVISVRSSVVDVSSATSSSHESEVQRQLAHARHRVAEAEAAAARAALIALQAQIAADLQETASLHSLRSRSERGPSRATTPAHTPVHGSRRNDPMETGGASASTAGLVVPQTNLSGARIPNFPGGGNTAPAQHLGGTTTTVWMLQTLRLSVFIMNKL